MPHKNLKTQLKILEKSLKTTEKGSPIFKSLSSCKYEVLININQVIGDCHHKKYHTK